MTGPVAKHSRVRQRKLQLKQNISVLYEDDLESFEANEPSLKEIQTGVEAHEEQEHHLQAVISAAQAAASGGATASQAYIPTRGTSASSIAYDALYSLKFSQPATYIRFSSTVEDCIDGASYDMVEEDDEFLKSLNDKLRTQSQQSSSRPTSRSAAAAAEAAPKHCSESQFETLMAAFETAARNAAPFVLLGDQQAPVLSLEEQIAQFPDTLPEENISSSPSSRSNNALLRALAPLVYPHWQSRRQATGNVPLTPTLKVKVLETGDAHDDNDPYVCFRRREVRAVRKTRGRDAQSAEKLRRLRRELEDARNLVALVRQREAARREQLITDQSLFKQRTELRGVKRSLPDRLQEGDEELLINQKPRKPKPIDTLQPARPSTTLRLPANRTEAAMAIAQAQRDGVLASTGPELQLIEDWLKAREMRQVEEIGNKIRQHDNWNIGYVDATKEPLTPPPPDDAMVSGFRVARTEYLPTPPASTGSQRSKENSDAAGVGEKITVGKEGSARQNGEMTVSPPEESIDETVTGVTSTDASTPGALAEISANTTRANETTISKNSKQLPVRVRYASPDSSDSTSSHCSPAFRRRIGRGGRMLIDRRHLHRHHAPEPAVTDPMLVDNSSGLTPLINDRFRFDRDSDDDEDDAGPNHVHKTVLDPFDWRAMLLRAQMSLGFNGGASHHTAQAQQAQQAAQQQRQKAAQLQAIQAAQNAQQSSGGTRSPQTLRQQVAAAAVGK